MLSDSTLHVQRIDLFAIDEDNRVVQTSVVLVRFHGGMLEEEVLCSVRTIRSVGHDL